MATCPMGPCTARDNKNQQTPANSTNFAHTIELTTNYMPCWSVVDVLGCALICTAGDVAKQAIK